MSMGVWACKCCRSAWIYVSWGFCHSCGKKFTNEALLEDMQRLCVIERRVSNYEKAHSILKDEEESKAIRATLVKLYPERAELTASIESTIRRAKRAVTFPK